MPRVNPRTLLTLFYLTAAVMVLLPATTTAADEAGTAPSTEVVTVAPSPFVYGMRVWIDPETGKLRQPTKAERAAVAERTGEARNLNKSSEGLVVQHRKDGSRFVDLQGRFMHSLVLTRNEDGTLTAHCNDRSHSHDATTPTTPSSEDAPVR